MSKLAINGGTPLVKDGDYKVADWPPVSEATADVIRDLYLSRAWSFNSVAEQEFEKAYAEHHGAKYGVFMANGTVTLECALEVLGIGPGDEVILPGLTWMATAMAIHYVGATPVFVDIEADTYALDPAAFEAAITPRTKAVIPVHLYGSMADLEKIIAIADKHGIKVVEDCAHMQGGMWNGRGVGSWGAIGSFSFQQSKTLSCGEGGICLTNDEKLADLLYRCKHIGYSRLEQQGGAKSPPPLGLTCHNYRGIAIEAKILHEQLPGLHDLLVRYQKFVKILREGVKDVEGLELQAPGRLATFQGYYALGMKFTGGGWDDIPVGRITEALFKEGVRQLGGNYGPVYKHMLYNIAPERYVNNGCPVCDKICPRVMNVMHYGLTFEENAYKLIDIIHKVAENKDELK